MGSQRPNHPSAVCTLGGRPAPGWGDRAGGSQPGSQLPAHLRGGRGEPHSKTREGRWGGPPWGVTGHTLPGRLGAIIYRELLLTPEKPLPWQSDHRPRSGSCGFWRWTSQAHETYGKPWCSGQNAWESRARPVTGCGSSSIFSPELQDKGTSTLGSEPVGTGPPTTRIPGLELFGILLFPFYYLPKSHVYLVEKSQGTMRCGPKTQPPSLPNPTHSQSKAPGQLQHTCGLSPVQPSVPLKVHHAVTCLFLQRWFFPQ